MRKRIVPSSSVKAKTPPKTMSDEAKAKLKAMPKTICAKCSSKRSYTNPMEKCFECKKKFCFDHVWRGLWKKGMRSGEELRIVCDNCKEKHKYIDL